MDVETLARVFDALSHPARIAIVVYVSKSRKGVVWGALWNALQELGMKVDERQLNFHVMKLVEAGVLVKVRVGRGKYVYKLNQAVGKVVKLNVTREALISSKPERNEGKENEGASVSEVHTEHQGTGSVGKEVERAGTEREQA